MRVSLSTYGSREDVESMVGLAVQIGALGAEARVWVPSDPPPHAAELVAAQLDTVAAAAEK
jgi:hypothetical protein